MGPATGRAAGGVRTLVGTGAGGLRSEGGARTARRQQTDPARANGRRGASLARTQDRVAAERATVRAGHAGPLRRPASALHHRAPGAGRDPGAMLGHPRPGGPAHSAMGLGTACAPAAPRPVPVLADTGAAPSESALQ